MRRTAHTLPASRKVVKAVSMGLVASTEWAVLEVLAGSVGEEMQGVEAMATDYAEASMVVAVRVV